MGSGDWDEGLLGNGIPVFCQTRLSPDFPPVSIPFMVVLFWLLDLKALLTGSSAEHSSHGSGEEEQSFAQIQTAVWLLSQAFTAFLETLLSLLALLCPTYVYGVIYTIASSLRGFGFWGSIVFAPTGAWAAGYIVSSPNLPYPTSCAFHGNLPEPLFSSVYGQSEAALSPEISHIWVKWALTHGAKTSPRLQPGLRRDTPRRKRWPETSALCLRAKRDLLGKSKGEMK